MPRMGGDLPRGCSADSLPPLVLLVQRRQGDTRRSRASYLRRSSHQSDPWYGLAQTPGMALRKVYQGSLYFITRKVQRGSPPCGRTQESVQQLPRQLSLCPAAPGVDPARSWRRGGGVRDLRRVLFVQRSAE